jgi:hypothetical protein
MKNYFCFNWLRFGLLLVFFGATAALAQDSPDSSADRPRPSARARSAKGDYSEDLRVVSDAQAEVLKKAREMLDGADNESSKAALEKAVADMEKAEKALEEAKNAPEKLPAALSAEKAAYQTLLKTLGHERNVRRGQRGQSGASAGQPSDQQMNQLELTSQENRYETERQASEPRTQEQKERLEIADRLKQLAQRQQDLNDRLRDLQTALQEARTEQEREEIQRQLKHLSDDERQMLSDMDELRQRMEQSQNANSLANARQQLEQARSDTARAPQELQNQSASQALAAGSRAQQTMQNLREGFRNQTSSQFSEQMRQLRSEARQMDQQEGEVERDLESLAGSGHKSLGDADGRQQLGERLNRQLGALTNLLSKVQDMSQQAETSEPLLSQQLYDTLRRANLTHTDGSLQTSAQLLGSGFLSQAAEAEHAARTNISQLRQSIDRAAESVLGNEADAIRFAQKELEDLTRQVQREVGGAGTNAAGAGAGIGRGRSNEVTSADFQTGMSTNVSAGRTNSGSGGTGNELAVNEASNSPNGGARGGRSSDAQNQNGEANSGRQNGRPGEKGQAQGANGSNPGQGQGQGQQPGSQSGDQAGNQNGGQRGGGSGNATQSGDNSQTAGNQSPGQGQGNANGNGGANGRANGSENSGNSLSELARQFGGNDSANPNNGGAAVGGGWGGPANGPITGSDFVNWADRMRGVEQVLDSRELRNQLATARERLATYRRLFIAKGTKPDTNDVRIRVLGPMTEVGTRLQEDLARLQDSHSLVPLDHDPVPDRYSDLVRKYYEKLGGGQ